MHPAHSCFAVPNVKIYKLINSLSPANTSTDIETPRMDLLADGPSTTLVLRTG